MACRQAFQCGAVLSMSLALLAVFADRSSAQAVGAGTGSVGAGAGAGGSSGTGATAISAGFTGGGGGGGGGYTGGTASGTGATMATGGFTGGGGGTGSSLGFTGGGGLTSGTSTNVPSSVNPFTSTYTNVYGAGLLNTSGQTIINKAFGQALYSTYSTAIGGSTASGGFGGAGGIGGIGGAGGIGGIGGMGSTTMSTANVGFNTFGMSRTPYYAATLGDGMPRVVHANPQLQASVADVVRRSTYVQSTTPLKIGVKDGTVFLEGAVPTEKQRRLVEGLIRTTPGVRAVVNNLEVTETLPTPTKSAARLGP